MGCDTWENKTPVEPHYNHEQRKERNKAMAKDKELLVLNCAIWIMWRKKKTGGGGNGRDWEE